MAAFGAKAVARMAGSYSFADRVRCYCSLAAFSSFSCNGGTSA